MAENVLGSALTSIMNEHGWTQVRLAAELGLDQPRISRMINGKLDLRINEAVGLFARVGWELHITPKSESDEPVKRREFNAKIAAAAAITLLPSTKVGPYEDPDYVMALGARIGRLRYEQGGTPLLAEAARHLKVVKGVVASRDQRLQSAASFLADKLSLALFDAGKVIPAENVGLLALTLGRKAGDPYRIGAAYESLVIQTRRADGEKATHYARQGLKVRELPGVLRARLHARHAASLSGAGGDGLSMAAIENAQGVPLDSHEGRAVVDGTTGLALYRLGRIEEGRASLNRAIQAFEGLPAPHARWMAQQVQASFVAGDLEAASKEMNRLALTVPLVNSAQLKADLRDVFRISARWKSIPEVSQAREILRTVANEINTGK